MSVSKTEDNFGRQIRPTLTNTKADGSGDWIYPAGVMDEISGAAIAIDVAHFNLHNSASFTCHYNQTVSDTNDKTIIAFKTPDTTTYIHCTTFVSATTAADAYMYEAPTIDADEGDSLAVYNRRRVGTPNETTVIRTNTNPDEVGAMSFSEANDDHVTSGTELTHNPLIAKPQSLFRKELIQYERLLLTR